MRSPWELRPTVQDGNIVVACPVVEACIHGRGRLEPSPRLVPPSVKARDDDQSSRPPLSLLVDQAVRGGQDLVGADYRPAAFQDAFRGQEQGLDDGRSLYWT